MKRTITLIGALLCIWSMRAQTKDTLEVQKIGDKFYVIVDHKDPDTVKYVTVDYHKKFDSHFMVAGLTTFGFNHTWNSTTIGGVLQKSKANSFGDVDRFEFSPMLLWRHGEHLLVEFEPSFDGNAIGVNWACASYFVHPGVILRAGYLVLPFGSYNKRLAAGWINKLASDPVSVGNSPVSSDWGIEMSGGLQAGKMKVNYDIALTNGFNINADGSLTNPGIVDNNIAKTVSGRFGWLPLSNSSLELGVSGLWDRGGPDGGPNRNTSAVMGAFDVQYVYSKKPIAINIKGQYNMTYVTNQNYTNPSDTSQMFHFTNLSTGYFVMLALRPVVANKVLRNFELAGSFSQYDAPKGAAWESHTRQVGVALDYWINWRTVIKLCYENVLQTNPLNATIGVTDSKSLSHMLIVQFSVQL